MEPVEPGHVPLAHVEQADDAHQVQRLDCHKTDRETHQFVLERGREGEDGGKQDDQCLDAIAARLDADGKPRLQIPDDLAIGRHAAVEQLDQEHADRGQQAGEWQDDMVLDRLQHLKGEQAEQQHHKQDGKFQHGRPLCQPESAYRSVW